MGTYDSNHLRDRPVVSGAVSGVSSSQTRTGDKKFVGPPNKPPMADCGNGVNVVTALKLKQCYHCHSYDHFVSQCKAPTPGHNGQIQAQFRQPGDQYNPRTSPLARVTRVITERLIDEEPIVETTSSRKTTKSKAADANAGDAPAAHSGCTALYGSMRGRSTQ